MGRESLCSPLWGTGVPLCTVLPHGANCLPEHSPQAWVCCTGCQAPGHVFANLVGQWLWCCGSGRSTCRTPTVLKLCISLKLCILLSPVNRYLSLNATQPRASRSFLSSMIHRCPLGPLGFEGAQHRQTLRPSHNGPAAPGDFCKAVEAIGAIGAVNPTCIIQVLRVTHVTRNT
jgi:hypothetical protein